MASFDGGPDVKVDRLFQPFSIGEKPRMEGAPERRKRRDQQGQHKKGTAKDYFILLTGAVENAHKTNLHNNSPFRFCIYEEGDKVFIDFALLGADGHIKEIVKKDITDEEFSNFVEHIEQMHGLFLDYTV